jgi:hypothetical protein
MIIHPAMGRTLQAPRCRGGRVGPDRFVAVAGPIQPAPTELGGGLCRFKTMAPDHGAGKPWRKLGEVGSYWTVPVRVPLSELAGVHAIVHRQQRLLRVRIAIANGVVLPPIYVGIKHDGHAFLVDGNHRLVAAREAGWTDIVVRFTFAGL